MQQLIVLLCLLFCFREMGFVISFLVTSLRVYKTQFLCFLLLILFDQDYNDFHKFVNHMDFQP